ncbi:hypothetical protein B0H11DRAFT_2192278 [Mycena galericulata]|nr:hypothetical protein B0H11DRAFT_2192278 [Mycena galericulata]
MFPAFSGSTRSTRSPVSHYDGQIQIDNRRRPETAFASRFALHKHALRWVPISSSRPWYLPPSQMAGLLYDKVRLNAGHYQSVKSILFGFPRGADSASDFWLGIAARQFYRRWNKGWKETDGWVEQEKDQPPMIGRKLWSSQSDSELVQNRFVPLCALVRPLEVSEGMNEGNARKMLAAAWVCFSICGQVQGITREDTTTRRICYRRIRYQHKERRREPTHDAGL